ncbi:MAG: carbohydrate ABC transporter permease [Clostridia bacterium]|nr:carbohydrate ABC transporter permease [Clostridia bacterium]
MKRSMRDALIQAFCLLLGLFVVFPLIYGALGAFKTPSEFSRVPPTVFPDSFRNFDNFRAVFEKAPMARYFLNSLITSTVSSLVRLVFAALAAYAFAFFEFPGKKPLFILVLGTMMLPAETITVTNYQTVSALRLTDHYLGIMIVSFVGASQMFMLRARFASTPRALREAAMLDGCSDLRFLLFVLLPVSRPVLVTLFLQSFIAQWNSYLWPLLVTNHDEMRTVQVGITMLTAPEATNYETILAGATVALIPALILFLVSRRKLSDSMSGGSLVG